MALRPFRLFSSVSSGERILENVTFARVGDSGSRRNGEEILSGRESTNVLHKCCIMLLKRVIINGRGVERELRSDLRRAGRNELL